MGLLDNFPKENILIAFYRVNVVVKVRVAVWPSVLLESIFGNALNRVMTEIEEIAVSTLKSITLTTLLKVMERD